MFKIKDRAISRQVTWLNMLVSGTALLLACLAFIGYDVVSYKRVTINRLAVQARMIEANSLSAILFNDSNAAEKTLSALKESPSIQTGVIYDNNGKVFAHYSRNAQRPIPSAPNIDPQRPEQSSVNNNEIVLQHTILVDGKPSGQIYIRSDMHELHDRLKLYAGISIIVLLVSLFAALIASALFRKRITSPIIRLADAAKRISHAKDYSVRVEAASGASELAVLISSFNEMLQQIEFGESELRKIHEELEERVRIRTAELLAAKEEMERTSKFKDQFLSTMSHELRTPLNAVLGFSEMLREERYGPLNDRQRRYVNHIHTGGQHLLRLINDILDISKIEAGRLQLSIENVPVDTAITEIVESLQPLAEKKSQTLMHHISSHARVMADPVRFKQILMNLVGNALKFTPEGGKIELRVEKEQDDVRIEIIDSGPGIPPEEQTRIFEAFHRIRQAGSSVEGTGLGLAITRSLIELHGGTLGLESEVGKGSRFYITLPIAQSPQRGEARRGDSGLHTDLSGHILVIDDDPAAAQLIESQLASVGYQVTICSDCLAALELAAALQPAAITLDIVMKPLNGWDLLSQLKSDSRTCAIPVVVVTMVDQKDTKALRGADEYIVKPVDKASLLAAIERCSGKLPQSEETQSILVVEDHLPTRELITEILRRNRYDVRAAADGAQARACMKERKPSLVMLDLILPDVSGFDLLAEWRMDAETSRLPVIVLTSKDLSEAERKFLRENVEALFYKQGQWQETLLDQIHRVAGPAPSYEVQ